VNSDFWGEISRSVQYLGVGQGFIALRQYTDIESLRESIELAQKRIGLPPVNFVSSQFDRTTHLWQSESIGSNLKSGQP
jgi:hypothetical protein